MAYRKVLPVPELAPTFPQTALSSLVLSADTSPRALWASSSVYQRTDTSSTQTNQFFATKVRQRIIGRWKAIAPVYLSRRWGFSVKKPWDTQTTSAIATIAAQVELPNGTQSLNFSSPNTGGTLIPVTFQGRTTARLVSGQLLVGDLIYASDHGRDYWEFVDTDLSQPHQQPWVRTAWSKAAASDNLWYVLPNINSGVAPRHDAVAIGTSFAQMQTLIATAGISSYNGTNNWGFGDSDGCPGPAGFIGIPWDSNQEAVIVMGTSIPFGETQEARSIGFGTTEFGTGTDWSAITWDTGQPLGWPGWASTHPTKAFPCWNLAIGGSALLNTWNETGAAVTWDVGLSTYSDYIYQRWIFSNLARYFTVFIAQDVHNDNDTVDNYRQACYSFTNDILRANPRIKIFGARVPMGGVDFNGSTVAYAAPLADRWAVQEEMVTNGWWKGILDLRLNGLNPYPNEGTIYSGTLGSGSTTTQMELGSNLFQTGQYTRAWVTIGADRRIISTCRRSFFQINTALSGSPSAGTAFTIEGNWAGGTNGADMVHSSAYGAKRMGDLFHSEIVKYIPTFLFSNKPR